MKVLNLGCGIKPMKNAVNVDIDKSKNPDIVWDLNKTPYPFDDGEFDEVHASGIIEHLEEQVPFITECHRILKPKGHLYLAFPNFFHWVTRINVLRGTLQETHCKTHQRLLSYNAMKDLVIMAGFKIVGENGGDTQFPMTITKKLFPNVFHSTVEWKLRRRE